MNTSKAWLMCAISTSGMLVFAAMYFATPNVAPIPKGFTPVDEPKNSTLVQDQNKIPVEYTVAKHFMDRMNSATFAGNEKALFGIKSIKVDYAIDDKIKQVVSIEEIKAKFELTLRRNNVPISSDSKTVLTLNIAGYFHGDSDDILSYNMNGAVSENQWIFRNEGECHVCNVIVKQYGYFGSAGKSLANKALLEQVENRAELFANDYLTANPK